MAGIFISYRREDSAGYVALLYRDLSASFGRDRVFMDIHTLQPGQDFVASLEEAVGECAVLLAVIGPHWVTATDEDGNRRLNKPNDYVALEIGSALARSDILVIPVRVGKAQRPSPGDLPEPLLALARRQDFELTDKRWDYDVETLIKRLETVVTPVEPKAPPQQSAEGESTEAVDYRVWLEPERTHGSGAERVGLVIENLSPRSMTFAIAPRRKDARLDVRVEAEQVQI